MSFHNITHTKEVVKNIAFIGKNNGLSKHELEPILIAGWFHDTGFLHAYKGHEDYSLKIAKDFLEKEEYNKEKLDIVLGCIEATKMPQTPTNIYERVICDADLFHLATNQFFKRNALLRKEWQNHLNMCFDEEKWLHLNIEFLEKQHYFTSYAQQNLSVGKQTNIKHLQQLLQGICSSNDYSKS
ncbi:HD domain-containing protein [Zhouia sp. PK063]|uniref:HD domain-containing protein n=1 Tax=Zhouia sp. PK063 TaxID=3373602 RepID=UPI00378D652D